MNLKEVEFKYKADNITLTDFHKFCQERKPELYVSAFGPDHFYQSSKEKEAFCRHRYGADRNELTFKRKTVDTNNFIRTELNIALDPSVKNEQVSALCSEFGYKYSRSIFKTCFIYRFEWSTLVYYICYNEDMNELGRFIEIEMREDYKWTSESEAYNSLTAMERLCKPLGINPKSRTKLSLFEMFGEK